MAYTTYNCDGLTGGTERMLDALSVADLTNKDRAVVAVSAGFYFFKYNSTGTAAETVAAHPYVIRPDDYTTGGNWEEYLPVSATAYTDLIKAWITFNGTGTISIIGSYNVASITDNGVGKYTVTFTSALSDALYAAVCSGSMSAAYLGYGVLKARPAAVGSCPLYFCLEDSYSGESFIDGDILCATFVR
jgi:hypothetical protein